MSTTTIGNGVTSEIPIVAGKDIQISCPRTAEQKDTEDFDEQQNILSLSTTEANEKEDLDADYNPDEEPEQESDDASSEEESEQSENEFDMDEEEIVNSAEFERELAAAIENVKKLGKYDGEKMLEKAAQTYYNETGAQATEQEIIDAFQTFTIEDVEQSVSECEEEEVEASKSEFAEALECVKEVAKYDQEIFVNQLCNTFVELTGTEPTMEQLKDVFQKIKNNFADEAAEEFIERNDAEDDSDSDYDEEDDEQQIEKDDKYCKKAKTEEVFVDNSEFDSEYDSEEETESESESEYSDVSSVNSGVEDSEEEESDDDDEDYDPENDAFDYTQDTKDNEQFEIELNGTDENEVECDDNE